MGEICKKLQESRMKWYGQVLSREEEYKHVDKTVMTMEVSAKRRRGTPMRSWLDNIRERLVGERIARGGSARPS